MGHNIQVLTFLDFNGKTRDSQNFRKTFVLLHFHEIFRSMKIEQKIEVHVKTQILSLVYFSQYFVHFHFHDIFRSIKKIEHKIYFMIQYIGILPQSCIATLAE